MLYSVLLRMHRLKSELVVSLQVFGVQTFASTGVCFWCEQSYAVLLRHWQSRKVTWKKQDAHKTAVSSCSVASGSRRGVKIRNGTLIDKSVTSKDIQWCWLALQRQQPAKRTSPLRESKERVPYLLRLLCFLSVPAAPKLSLLWGAVTSTSPRSATDLTHSWSIMLRLRSQDTVLCLDPKSSSHVTT